jgi:hypothetical protein
MVLLDLVAALRQAMELERSDGRLPITIGATTHPTSRRRMDCNHVLDDLCSTAAPLLSFEKADGGHACHSLASLLHRRQLSPAQRRSPSCVMLREINRTSIQEASHGRIWQPRPLLAAWYFMRVLSRPQVSGKPSTDCAALLRVAAAALLACRGTLRRPGRRLFLGRDRPTACLCETATGRALPHGSRLACLTMPRPEIAGCSPVHVRVRIERRLGFTNRQHGHRCPGVSLLGGSRAQQQQSAAPETSEP